MIAPDVHVPAFVHALAQLLEPWHSLYTNSKPLGIGVMFIHIAALLIGGGFAVAADRTTLRVPRQDRDMQRRHLAELHAVHRPILIAIVVLLVSGIAMAAADVEAMAVSIPFWTKITCVTLLLINGCVLYKTEETLRTTYTSPGNHANANLPTDRADALWKRLRTTSIASLVLWLATALAGTVLSAS